MKVSVEFIDSKGFWHYKVGKSIRLVKEWIKHLHPQTEVSWTNKHHVIVTQQYVKV